MYENERRQERGQLIRRARGLLDSAKAANRGLSAAEQQSYDGFLARANAIKEQLAAEERGQIIMKMK